MKAWNKPQLTNLSAEMTEYTWQGPGQDGAWSEVVNPPTPIPDGVLGRDS